MANISDVARRAGVSAATVSRVINGIRVTPDLAEAVHAAVADLAFVPSGTARTLRRRRSPLIAFICPDLADPYVRWLVRGAQQAALCAGCTLVICCSDGLSDREQDLLRLAVSESMTGVLLLPVDAARSPFRDDARVVVLSPPTADEGFSAAESRGAAAVDEILAAPQSTGSTENRYAAP